MKNKMKYELIEEDIIRAIKSGEYQPGDKVPSESELKRNYNVSTITVRRAFTDLISQGYLVGKQGAGTFVAEKQLNRMLTSLSFSEELKKQQYTVAMEIDSIQVINSDYYAAKLGIESGSNIVRIARVRVTDNIPLAYHISYIPEKLLTLEQAEGIRRTRSLYETMKKNGLVPDSATENYSIKQIKDKNIANQMNTKKDSDAFFVKRTTRDADNRIIEYAETYFDKDRYSVTVTIKNN